MRVKRARDVASHTLEVSTPEAGAAGFPCSPGTGPHRSTPSQSRPMFLSRSRSCVDSAPRANKVVKQHRDLTLSNQAFDRFIAELDKPPAAVDKLVELFKRNPKLPEG